MMSRINLNMEIDGVSSPWRLHKEDKSNDRSPKEKEHRPRGKREPMPENETKEQPHGFGNKHSRDQGRSGRNQPGNRIDVVV